MKKSYSYSRSFMPEKINIYEMFFRRKILIISTFVILFFLPIAYLTTRYQSKTEAAWADDNFAYRNSIPVSSHTAAENNVYVSTTLDTSASGQFQPDCGDLRFTDYAGKQLPYYIVSGCGTATTVVHIFLQSFPAGAQTLYYYYGNPSASNGFNTSDFATQASNYVIGGIGSQEKGTAPVAYWKLDEGYGTTAYDSAQNGNNGSITGTTWKSENECLAGKCLFFDGSGDYVQKTDGANSVLDLTNGITISLWTKQNGSIDANTQRTLVGKSSAYALHISYGQLRFTVYNSGGSGCNTTYCQAMSGTVLQPNRWYHLVGTFNGNTIKVYVDGVLMTQQSWNYAMDTNNNAINIGDNYWGAANGVIDDVKIYNYARTAAQIKADFMSKGSGSVKGTSASFGANVKNSDALSN